MDAIQQLGVNLGIKLKYYFSLLSIFGEEFRKTFGRLFFKTCSRKKEEVNRTEMGTTRRDLESQKFIQNPLPISERALIGIPMTSDEPQY